MTNKELVESFASGAVEGYGSHLTIRQDILYSYAMPIAKRLEGGGFQISNAMRALGGNPVSQTTSTHIGLAHYYCKPSVLVDMVKVTQ